MPFRLIFALSFLFLTSCAFQNKLRNAQQLVAQAKADAASEKQNLGTALQKAIDKLEQGELDPLIKSDYERVLAKLNHNLDSIQQRINTLEDFLKERSNLRGNKYQREVAPYVAALDSFRILKQKREIVYRLVNESLAIDAFNLYNMAAFFQPGVYKIPLSARSRMTDMFSPVVDSIKNLADKYSSIPRTARLVFVGYADESPISAGSNLYNDLKRFSAQSSPGREELNRVLSQLRANEMMRNMEMVIIGKSGNFNSFHTLSFNYFNYGRGEAYPSAKISDYKKNDERRRIVMFYWSVLPRVD